MTSPPRTILLGTQGWNYDAWVGALYPSGTRQADFLATYTRAFDTVEVDSTFYAIPPEKTVLGWAERTPPTFASRSSCRRRSRTSASSATRRS